MLHISNISSSLWNILSYIFYINNTYIWNTYPQLYIVYKPFLNWDAHLSKDLTARIEIHTSAERKTCRTQIQMIKSGLVF